MAVKTITITEEAYNILKRMKYNDKSFSEVIVEFADRHKGNAVRLFGILGDSANELDELQKKIKERRKSINVEARERAIRIRRRLDDRS